MTLTNVLRFVSILLVAISMSAGLAHLFALPNKIGLPRDAYLTVQQIYRGWALLGIAVIGALLSTSILAFRLRGARSEFRLTLAAAICVAGSLAVFFSFTFPANQQTLNWTMLPDGWEALRQQWEYSHAVGAVLYLAALVLLTLSLLVRREESGGVTHPSAPSA
ncbi:MAG TPA: DUF1772 domain-containing protein [Gammaproteobacteria bacterium]